MEKYILKSKNQGSFSFVYSYGSYIKILMKVVCMKSFDIKNKVSIIIPVYNEEENIDIIVQKIVELPIKNKEILFIDDGSTDNTLEKIHNNSKSNTDIKYISLSRNFGHQIALKVGFDYCSGDCAITMDGDMQHPPEVIIEMLERWVYGAEVVHTRRLPEENQSIFKRVTSKYFYKFINFCSSVDIQPGTADFRLLDAKIVQICQQKALEEQIPEKEARLEKLKAASANVSTFVEKAKQYTAIDELTPELLRLFIQRIEVGERTEKYSRSSHQSIRIVYRDIGTVDSAMEQGEAQPRIAPPLSEVFELPA